MQGYDGAAGPEDIYPVGELKQLVPILQHLLLGAIMPLVSEHIGGGGRCEGTTRNLASNSRCLHVTAARKLYLLKRLSVSSRHLCRSHHVVVALQRLPL